MSEHTVIYWYVKERTGTRSSLRSLPSQLFHNSMTLLFCYSRLTKMVSHQYRWETWNAFRSWFPRDQKKTSKLKILWSLFKYSNKSGVKSKTDWNNSRSEMKETLQTSFVRSSVSQNCKTTKHVSFLQLFPAMVCPSNTSMWAESLKIPDFLLDLRWFMALQLPTLCYWWLSGLVPAPEMFQCKPLIYSPEETMECLDETFSKERVQDSARGDSIL